MALPAIGPDGLLPPGRHRATWDEVWSTFVEVAPFRPERQRVFDALRMEVAGLVEAGGPSAVWVDGGFVTHKRWAAPLDVDVVYLCSDEAHILRVLNHPRGFSLLTLQDVLTWRPVTTTVPRLQPMGGLVDAFLATPGRFDYWHGMWSAVKDEHGEITEGAVKGYVEVIV